MRTEHLASAARQKRWGVKASGGRWQAFVNSDDNVVIQHYSTYMMAITPSGEALPLSAGWGSVSDKQGINKILRFEKAHVVVDGERLPATYATVFGR